MTDKPIRPASSETVTDLKPTRTQPALPAEARFDGLRERFDLAQLERTITGLRATLPEPKAREAEETMRRMFNRARRWEN